jgi:hypothetical protein
MSSPYQPSGPAPFQPNLTGLGPSATRRPQGPPPLTEADLTWIGEYPELQMRFDSRGRSLGRALCRRTYAGVVYGLAPSQHLGPLARLGWSIVQGFQDRYLKIIGDPAHPDETTCDSIVLLGHGTPIPGTEGNGRRRFKIHLDIERATGLIINPTLNIQNGKVTDGMVARAKAQTNQQPTPSQE